MNNNMLVKSLNFVLILFVSMSIDVLDSENWPRSGKIRTGSGFVGLTEGFIMQKYEEKKYG